MDNLGKLTARDQVKIVICSRSDYEWARELLRVHATALPCQVLFSPSFGQRCASSPNGLADRLDVRLQVQLHKMLWGEVPGR